MIDNIQQDQAETSQINEDWTQNSVPADVTKSDEIKTVNVVISGATYPVNCPASEQPALEKAARYINNFITDLRKDAPTLSHENLLVLCCLNLFEKIDQQASKEKSQSIQEQRMRILLDKISKDAQSVLTEQ